MAIFITRTCPNFQILTGRYYSVAVLTAVNSSRNAPFAFEDIPGPKSFPILGTIPHYISGNYDPKRMHRTGMKKYKEFGKIVREEITPGKNIVWLYDPNDMETLFRMQPRWPLRESHTMLVQYRTVDRAEDHNCPGLVAGNGEPWGKLRTSFQKLFLKKAGIQSLVPSTDEVLREFVTRFNEPELTKVGNKDFLNVINATVCELLGLNVFGQRWNSLAQIDQSDSLSQKLISSAMKANYTFIQGDQNLKLWKYFPTPLYRNMRKEMDFLEGEAKRLINLHLNDDVRVGNVSCLIKQWIEEGDKDHKDLLTVASDLLLAGVDTTSSALAFIMYNVSKHPQVQEKLYEELCSLAPSKETPITANMLEEASYLKAVIKESLRINPVTLGNGRTLQSDAVFSGYAVPSGTHVITVNQVACQLPEYFEQADKFIPERFVPGSTFKKAHPYLVLPFGIGTRSCIGRTLATQTLRMMLFQICRHWHLTWNGSSDLDSVASTINNPDRPLQFKFTLRQQ